jgi:hypothetical protein
VFVRKGSIYDESLVRLNEQLKARGKPAVIIDQAPDELEDDDVLEPEVLIARRTGALLGICGRRA